MTVKPILLVEDSPDDADLTLMSLRETGLLNEVVVVEDGVEALDYLFATGRFAGRNPKSTPALVLLDLKMPRMGGIEVLQRLRADERTRVVPVVMLTTSKEDIDLVNAYQSGANAYVRKPVSLAEFSQAVKKLGMFWLLLNELPPELSER